MKNKREIFMNKTLPQNKTLLVTLGSVLLTLVIFSSFLLHASPTHAASQLTHGALAQNAGAQQIKVFVEPAAGEQPVLDAINNARTSIYVEMYLLTDTNVISALENAAKNGLDVRVMLEEHPFGGSTPTSTMQALSNAGAKT